MAAMGPPDRHAPLLREMSWGDVAGGLLAGLIFAGTWVGIFFSVAGEIAHILGATGTAWTLMAVVLPLLLTVGFVALMAQALRSVARRRRRLREEFTEPLP